MSSSHLTGNISHFYYLQQTQRNYKTTPLIVSMRTVKFVTKVDGQQIEFFVKGVMLVPWVIYDFFASGFAHMLAPCLPDGHMMNVLERSPPCRCTTSECDGLTCGSVVSMTAQDRKVTSHHIAEQVPGECITTQKASNAYH